MLRGGNGMPSIVNRHGEAADVHAPEIDTLSMIADEVRFLPIHDMRAVIIAILLSWGQFRKEDLACTFYTVAGHVSRQKRRGEDLIRRMLTQGLPTSGRKVLARPKKRIAPPRPKASRFKHQPGHPSLF